MVHRKTTSFILAVIGISILLTGCANDEGHSVKLVPKNWYALPENNFNPGQNKEDFVIDEDDVDSEPIQNMYGLQVEKLFRANGEALQASDLELNNEMKPKETKDRPTDWVPWHAEYFIFDLAISAQGLLGGLIAKGSPSVTTNWRRQYLKSFDREIVPPDIANRSDNAESIVISDESAFRDLEIQVDPVIDAAMATGKFTDKQTLKKNLLASIRDFQTMTQSLANQQHQTQWWISRIRMDFTASASGVVSPTTSLDGEVRFRVEWHRIMKKQAPSILNADKGLDKVAPLNQISQNLKTGLQNFVQTTAEDLDEMSAEAIERYGFKPFQFRIGVGMTAGGTIGIAKGSTSIIGQVYFSSDVPKPVVNLKPSKRASNDSLSAHETINLIETGPSRYHSAMATQLGVPFDTVAAFDGQTLIRKSNIAKNDSRIEQIVYKVNRKAFRKGLKKAARLGAFFAKRASKIHVGPWKIYELRTTFDVSVTGTVGLVTLAGNATGEVCYYNQNF